MFKGNGWDGIDAHWRAKHEATMLYEEFWDSLCEGHRGTREANRRSSPREALDIHYKALENELLSSYRDFAYVAGVRRLARLEPTFVERHHCWGDLYRYAIASLFLRIAKFTDHHSDSLSIHSLQGFLHANCKALGHESVLKDIAANIVPEFEAIGRSEDIKRTRDWYLAHIDRRSRREGVKPPEVPFADLKAYVKLLDVLLNRLRLVLDDTEVMFENIFDESLRSFSFSVRLALGAHRVITEERKLVRECRPVRDDVWALAPEFEFTFRDA